MSAMNILRVFQKILHCLCLSSQRITIYQNILYIDISGDFKQQQMLQLHHLQPDNQEHKYGQYNSNSKDESNQNDKTIYQTIEESIDLDKSSKYPKRHHTKQFGFKMECDQLIGHIQTQAQPKIKQNIVLVHSEYSRISQKSDFSKSFIELKERCLMEKQILINQIKDKQIRLKQVNEQIIKEQQIKISKKNKSEEISNEISIALLSKEKVRKKTIKFYQKLQKERENEKEELNEKLKKIKIINKRLKLKWQSLQAQKKKRQGKKQKIH